jgi:hypothetical protein
LQFGKYLEEKKRLEWRDNYIGYEALKKLIKESADEAAGVSRRPGYRAAGLSSLILFSCPRARPFDLG